MLRRLGPRGDGGAGVAEYAGLVVLAALILGALYAVGIPSKVETGVGTALCKIMGGSDCGTTEAAGQKGDGGQNGDGQGNGNGEGNGNGQGDGNGDEPSLADLQRNADNAQKAADSASSKYGNIKQQIIDLLKDFIGITDIEECITKGSISSCLWAAFDVGSWIFAALKIGKFAKAVVKAVKLWKDFNRGRKIIERTKNAAKRAKELLKKRRRECGLPVPASFPMQRHAPPRIVHADLAYAGGPPAATVTHAAVALAPAKPKKGRCGTGDGKEDKPPERNPRTPAEKQQILKDMGYQKTSERSHGQPVYKAPKGSDGPKYLTPDRDAHNGGDFKGADTPKDLANRNTRSGTYRYEDGKLVRVGD